MSRDEQINALAAQIRALQVSAEQCKTLLASMGSAISDASFANQDETGWDELADLVDEAHDACDRIYEKSDADIAGEAAMDRACNRMHERRDFDLGG